MFRGPPKLIYIRWIGAVCAAIPFILFVLLAGALGYLSYESFIWSLTHFAPMVLFGYALDVVYGVFPKKISRNKYPLVPFMFGWIIGYSFSYLIGDTLSWLILNDFSLVMGYLQNPYGMLLSLFFLGLLYGFFFYGVYMVFLRFYLRKKLKPYVEKERRRIA